MEAETSNTTRLMQLEEAALDMAGPMIAALSPRGASGVRSRGASKRISSNAAVIPNVTTRLSSTLSYDSARIGNLFLSRSLSESICI